jgi:predicted PurR-regulated permease PerM
VEKITRFNNRIRQVVLLVIILLLTFLTIKELYIFVPGFLGAVTLYILTRGGYQKLVKNKKWSKAWTAALFILLCLIGIMIPMYFTVKVMMPRVSEVFTHSEELMKGINELSNQVYQYTGTQLLTKENITALEKMVANFIPTFLHTG